MNIGKTVRVAGLVGLGLVANCNRKSLDVAQGGLQASDEHIRQMAAANSQPSSQPVRGFPDLVGAQPPVAPQPAQPNPSACPSERGTLLPPTPYERGNRLRVVGAPTVERGEVRATLNFSTGPDFSTAYLRIMEPDRSGSNYGESGSSGPYTLRPDCAVQEVRVSFTPQSSDCRNGRIYVRFQANGNSRQTQMGGFLPVACNRLPQ